MLGVNQERKEELCNNTCMCGLTLAWVTSENSTSNWNADIFWLNLLRWALSCLLLSPESTAFCPWFHANSLLTRLSARRQLLAAPLSSQLSFASPYHFRIRRDFRFKNPLSGFEPKQTKESSDRATHIVLHKYLRINKKIFVLKCISITNNYKKICICASIICGR